MWQRTVELTHAQDGIDLRDEAVSGPECRLRAALLRFRGRSDAPTDTRIAGAAWEGPDGVTYWGWKESAGPVRLKSASARPDVCALLPTALALALALRRSGGDPGARAVVIGDGFLGRLARAVAVAAGCRVVTEPATPPDLVIETTAESPSLDQAAALCRPWGRIYSMGGGLGSAPFEYYPQVHSRALTLAQVPDRPVLLAGEEDVVGRAAARLTDALGGIAPAPDQTVDARVQPAGYRATVSFERSGWGLLLVGE